jgi:hypothetical protein
VRELIGRFDWDGVNLAELYFESLEGIGNPSRFTPMNDDVRAEFRRTGGFDPIELFRGRATDAQRAAFLDYRAGLAQRIEREWLEEMEGLRRSKPYLDLVLTHVDDRFDRGIREAIGADAERVLPLLDTHRFTFLIEDPATVWNLGPQRYQVIAERYRALTAHRERLAIDVNIVERYQDVYPTKQQTGIELYEIIHIAAGNFPRLALYFENSLEAPDLGLVSSAAAAVTRFERIGRKIAVESANGVGVPWLGGAVVDGMPWPAVDGSTVWLPAGAHSIEPGTVAESPKLVRFNGELKSARILGTGKISFSYESAARAIAVLDAIPKSVQVDGEAGGNPVTKVLLLPRGQHFVTISAN